AVAWLPDGRRVVSAGDGGSLKLWDALTGRLLRTFVESGPIVSAVAISPSGTQLVSAGGKDEPIRLWDLEGGKELTTFGKPGDKAGREVRGLAFSPDGQRIAAGWYGNDTRVELWDLQSGAAVRSFAAPNGASFYGVAFSPDGRRVLATTYGKGDVWVWNVDGDGPRLRLTGHTNHAISGTFSPDGSRILTGSLDNTLRLWDAKDGSPIGAPFTGHAAGVRGAAFVGSGASAASCSEDGTLKLWDVATGQCVRTLAGHTHGVRGLSVSATGECIVSGGKDRTVRVWSLRPNNEVPSVLDDPAHGGAAVTTLAPTADGLSLVSGNEAGGVTLRDVATLRTLQTYAGHDRPIECAIPLDGGRRLFTADDMGAAKLWDVASGREVRSFPPRLKQRKDPRLRSNDWCYTAVSRDGGVAVSSVRRTVEVWSPASGEVLGELGPHDTDVTCVAIAPGGKRALIGDMDGTMYYWDLATRVLVSKTPRPDKPATLDCVTFATDGKTALAGGHDNVVRLWDLTSLHEVRAFQGHTLMVRAAGFGHAGRTIFSAGGDRTLRLFETDSGGELDLAAQFPAGVFAAVAVPPGHMIAVASGPRISVWDVSRAERHVEAESRVAAACDTLRDDPNNAAALRTLGEWYAFRGADNAAIDLLGRAQAAGDTNVSALTLARCHWRLGHDDDAARAFLSAIERSEAPAPYVNLCLAALERAKEAAKFAATNPAAP
ncbi:MAG: hypothetical protein M3478_07180, partial [Planctomycetota bacterium]|nr:hypothetical protein [Planctomycetota bacterium]